MDCVRTDLLQTVVGLLKEQNEWLHKKQHDIDRLCTEISEWKRKFHDKSLKEQEAVVHCRECKLYEKCELNDLMLNHENGFCADGERKDEE